MGIEYNANDAGTTSEWASIRVALSALFLMTKMLAPHLNEQVLGEFILGIEYNAKYAGTLGIVLNAYYALS